MATSGLEAVVAIVAVYQAAIIHDRSANAVGKHNGALMRHIHPLLHRFVVCFAYSYLPAKSIDNVVMRGLFYDLILIMVAQQLCLYLHRFLLCLLLP